MKNLALVSLHLNFCRPSYGLLAKTSRVGLSSEFLDSLVLDNFVNLTCANNLIWLEADLGSMIFMKNILLCLAFPMV